jgi:hypothetical protein
MKGEGEKVWVKSTSDIFSILNHLSSYEDFQALVERLDLPQIIAQDLYTKLIDLTGGSNPVLHIQNEDFPQDAEYLSTLAANYLRRQLSDRLYYTVQALTMESLHFATGERISISQLRDLYGKTVTPTSTERRVDLPVKGRGGDRRRRYEWTNERLIAFSYKADDLRPLWDSVVSFFGENDYEIECLIEVKKLDIYKRFAKKCKRIPEGLLQRVLRRKNEKGREYWPFTLALEHARREMDIEYEYGRESLNKFYKEGLSLRSPNR